MYGQFFMVYPPNLVLPTIPAIPTLHPYPCSLYTYNPIPFHPNPYQELENIPTTSDLDSSVKVEEVTTRQQPETPPMPVKNPNRFKYAKKNVESNVVNQCFSYLTSRAKSWPALARVLNSEEKMDAFYEIMKQAKKKNNKYMGRNVLEALLLLDDDHPVYILHKKLRFKVSLKINEIRHALRVLTTYFFNNLIVPTILTSSKMDKSTIKQHLARAREIHRFLTHRASPYF